MDRFYRVLALAVVIAVVPGLAVSAYGQDDSDSAKLKEDVKALRQDVAVLSFALLKLQTTMDTQFKKVLAEVKKVATAAKPAADWEKKRGVVLRGSASCCVMLCMKTDSTMQNL